MNVGRQYKPFSSEYETLLAPDCKLSLAGLLELSDMTDGFEPHYLAVEVENRVADFARRHNIWLADRGEHYNTMTAYLHPTAIDSERLYLLGAYYAVLFFIDDVMGNEFRHLMSDEENAKADMEMRALLTYLGTGEVTPNTKLVPPTQEVIEGFRKLGDEDWVNGFVDFTYHHLKLAVEDLDSDAMKRQMTTERYVQIRNHVSGMYPAIRMMEFAEDNYLPNDKIREAGLDANIERLEFLCAAIGGLVNDFFSFEKEVMDSTSDFNLIPVMMHNYGLSLTSAIHMAAEYTNQLCEEYYVLSAEVREAVAKYPWRETVLNHIYAMDLSNQAVWVWQMDTDRYLRDDSIFRELCAQSPDYEPVERLSWLQR